jgi:anti-sigma B factor antagonist
VEIGGRMALEVKVRKKNGTPIIALGGRAIGSDVEKFAKKLESLYKNGSKTIILDLSEVSFLDSQGLGKIVYYYHIMEKAGRSLVILNANPDPQMFVRRLFSLTNLDRVLKIVDDINQVWGEENA